MLITQPAEDVLLSGRVIRADGSFGFRHIHIASGRVASIARHRPALAPDVREVHLGHDDWIFPGFIDLHSHSDYNFLPLWSADEAPFDNRFSWRGSEAYERQVRQVYKSVLKAFAGAKPDGSRENILLAVFAELQAIAGGTTTLQEPWALEDRAGTLDPVLVRSTASARELDLPVEKTVLSVVDFFAPDAAGRPAEKQRGLRTDGQGGTWIEHYCLLRDTDRLAACLVHIAEGRCGRAGQPVDRYTREEFLAFLAHPAFQDAGRMRESRISLIHGCGIDTEDPGHLTFLHERGIVVVWSPVSNLLLYGDTLDVGRLLDAGIPVALGSDWSPSGSKHIWDEAKFARFLIDAANLPVSDAQVLEMITSVPARALGNPELGRLSQGAWADLVVLRSPIASDNPLEALFRSTDRDVRLVMVAGRAHYGSRELLGALGVSWQPLPEREGSAVVDKAVYLPDRLRPDRPIRLAAEIDGVEEFLKNIPTPEGPILRSNLLSESDRPYRTRLADLKSRAVLWGDALRERRRLRRKERGLQ